MGNITRAKRFLDEEPLKNSYLIAKLDDENVNLYMKNDKAVLLESGGYISMRGEKNSLITLLSELKNKEYRFHAIDNTAFEAVKEVVKLEDDRPTWFLKRPKEYFEEPELEVEELDVKDAEIINEYWGLQGSDSTDYIAERIRKGPAYGIRRDGELAAWTLTHYMTDEVLNLGFLHVRRDWRREGFAKAITEHICRYAEENQQVPVVDIFKTNKPSISLAETLGFQRVSEHHWFNGMKEK